MEKLSRVKKYEDLRKQIEENVETSMDLEKETSIETLHTIEPAHYKKMKIEETSPKREQNEEFEENTETFQFKNEFLDEFINEVREYNLKKGNRVEDDTQMDILSQLKGTAPKRTQYISPLESEELTFGLNDTTSSFSKEEIAKQVQELLQEDNSIDSTTNQESSYVVRPFQIEKEEIEKEESEEVVMDNELNNNQEEIENALPIIEETVEINPVDEMNEVSRKLVEETQKMKIQLDSYEEELTGLNDGLDRTHRMLNIILCLLIICLIGAIGFVVYYILQSGGML